MINIKDKIRQSTSSEHDEFVGIMEEGLHNEDPKVGIFWYNPQRNELFGVVALSLDDPEVTKSGNGKTCKILHKKKWAIEYRKLKFKEKKENTFPYIGAYEDKPRGRVFYKDNKFIITVGSWINDDENYRAIDLVEDVFDLTNEDTEIVIDSHWEIGTGWENL